MATELKPLAVGEVIRTGFNLRIAKIASILGAFPGSQISSGTVGNDRLTSRRAVMAHTVNYASLGSRASADIIWGGKVPQFDSASDSSWYLKSYSIFVRSISGAGSNTLTLYKNLATTGNTIDLGALSSGVSARAGWGSPVTFTTDDTWDVRYTKSGAPTIDDVTLTLYFSKYHVTNG